MQKEETTILICVPVEGDPNRYIVPRSLEANCADCGLRVYVAPSGQKLQATKRVIIVCMKCGLLRLEREKEPKFEMVPGQDKEVKQYPCTVEKAVE